MVYLTEIFRVSTLALALIAMVTPTHANAADFEVLLQSARAARDAKDFEEAARFLEQAYAIKPLPVILNNLGKAYEELGRYRAAHEAYRTVANDTKADPKLRALDESRLAKLAPLLGRAWLRLSSDLEGVQAFVGSSPTPLLGDVDQPCDPGDQTIEFRTADGQIVLRQLNTIIGTRITIGQHHLSPGEAPDAIIELPSGKPTLQGITIGRHPIGTELIQIKHLAIKAGSYALELTFEGGLRKNIKAELKPGESIKLSAPLPVTTVASAKASKSQDKSSNAVALTALATGLVLGGVGTYLLTDYQSAADDLMANQQITQTEAYGQRQTLYEQRRMGHWTVGTGAVVAAVGIGLLLWNKPGPSAEPALTMHLGPRAGQVFLKGHFQ